MTVSRGTVFATVAAAAVLGAVVAGLVALGPPATQRERRLDDRRLDDLRAIAGGVDLYWTRNGRLPQGLDDLPPELDVPSHARDPETGEPYAYEPIDGERYRVCATFERDSSGADYGSRRDFWAHPAGRDCFELEAKRVGR